MDAETAAAALNGCEYGEEGSREFFKQMRAAGLVAVFGASDDLMEFRGAIDDEVGAFDGSTALITPCGLLSECECECKHYEAAKRLAVKVEAIWARPNEPAWIYETTIPHETFTVNEDGDVYCRGIVFKLSDAVGSPDASEGDRT